MLQHFEMVDDFSETKETETHGLWVVGKKSGSTIPLLASTYFVRPEKGEADESV